MFDGPAELSAEETLAFRVSHFRENRSMSQSELARSMSAAGFSWSQSTVYKVENEGRKLTFLEGLELARILFVEPDDLADMRQVVNGLNRQRNYLVAASKNLNDVEGAVAGAKFWLERNRALLHPNEIDSLEMEIRQVTRRLNGDSGA